MLCAVLLVLGTASPIAAPEATSVYENYNETALSESHFSSLQSRTEGNVNCGGGGIFEADVKAYRAFLDRIPNTVWSLQKLKRIVIYSKSPDGRYICATIRRSKNTKADGQKVRWMLREGYAQCVSSGRNLKYHDHDLFLNYIVEARSGDFFISAGGGFFNCRGQNGEKAGECLEVRV